MLHAEEIAAASDRLTVLVMGTNDPAKELYAEHVPGRHPLLTGLSSRCSPRVPRARPSSTVSTRREEHRRLPRRVPAGPGDGLRRQDPDPPRPSCGANEAFAPSQSAADDARGILQAWEDGRGSGVVTYNGRMFENLHVESAQRVLTMHESILALEGGQ